MNCARYIDHTLLKPMATSVDIRHLCEEAIQYNFYAVCVNGCYVQLCNDILKSTEVKIASVIGFPLGAMDTISKMNEMEQALKHGADEIDMVINIGLLKDNKLTELKNESTSIKNNMGSKILKVIIETCYLTNDEKRIVTEIVLESKADFVKTSTGFGSGGATLDDILLLKSITQNKIQIKASGGIRDYDTAQKYINLGVTRIGTSNGIQIVTHQIQQDTAY